MGGCIRCNAYVCHKCNDTKNIYDKDLEDWIIGHKKECGGEISHTWSDKHKRVDN